MNRRSPVHVPAGGRDAGGRDQFRFFSTKSQFTIAQKCSRKFGRELR
jgi:hypothetical protein